MTRMQLARGVVVLAALTTLATSAPENPRVCNAVKREIAVGQLVSLEFVLDEAATRHVQAHAGPLMQVRISGVAGTLLDASGEPVERNPGGWSSHPLVCAGANLCTVRLRYQVGPTAGQLEVDAFAQVTGDPLFFGPEDRRFPEGATLGIEVTVDRE